jgi:hypothetical protein
MPARLQAVAPLHEAYDDERLGDDWRPHAHVMPRMMRAPMTSLLLLLCAPLAAGYVLQTLSPGYQFTCGILANGALQCWGAAALLATPPGVGWIALSSGYFHAWCVSRSPRVVPPVCPRVRGFSLCAALIVRDVCVCVFFCDCVCV